jgi:hypothetical protein
MQKQMGEDALKDLEVELGMRAPEVAAVVDHEKDLGPAETATESAPRATETEK